MAVRVTKASRSLRKKGAVLPPKIKCGKCGQDVQLIFTGAEDAGRIRIAGRKCECGRYTQRLLDGQKYQEVG